MMKTPKFWAAGQGGALSLLLAPLGWLYGLGSVMRRAGRRPWRAGVPVICVGNLVAGGGGKTPTVKALAKYILRQNVDLHLLARGHGGSVFGPCPVNPKEHNAQSVGDEALLLAQLAPTWVARDRRSGARAAVAAGADLLLLDDGFQDPSLHHDLSLLVIDGGYGFGNGRMIPAGPLREPVRQGLARADRVIVIGEGTTIDIPHLRGHMLPASEALHLRGETLVAFAGIGRPEKFFAMLRELGCKVVAAHAFADHHRYGPEEIMALVEQAQALGALLVTTAKDQVRLPPGAAAMTRTVHVDLVFDDGDAIEALLAPILESVQR